VATYFRKILKANKVSSQHSASLFLTRVPLEIQFKALDELLYSHHIILMSPNGKRRGVLKPLAQACKAIRADIRKWLEGMKETHIVRNPTFGVFNDEVTTFKMSWTFTSSREGF